MFAVVVVVLAACGAAGGGRTQTAGPKRAAPALAGPGHLVPIGPHRSLYMTCVGAGSPAVVLEAGFGGDTWNWSQVQPELGRSTRTCAYDRAGIGSSLAVPGVHDAQDEIVDLGRLLHAAHVAPPYVLVGHSYGGLLVRLFARERPKDVAGIVLVDSMGRDQTRRTLAIWPPTEFTTARRIQASRVRDGVDLAAGEALAARIRSLEATPLVVVTAGRHDAEWGAAPRRLAHSLDTLWTRMQDELAALSSDHVHVVALRSDHFIQGPGGQPDVVTPLGATMSASISPTPPSRRSAGRIAVVIVGSLLALGSLCLFVAGGAALWADGKKDDQGYLSTRTERFHTTTAALRTENLDVDLGGTGTLLGSELYGKVRLHVTPRTGKDVFVGIARTGDVNRYLRGTAHTSVTDIDYHPFHADYAMTGGTQRAVPPAAQRIWAAQAHGRGAQTLTWDVDDGDWSVVVMNADGSPGVDAGVRAGADVPFLDDLGWAALGIGAVLLVGAVALVYSGAHSPRRPEPGPPAPAAAAA